MLADISENFQPLAILESKDGLDNWLIEWVKCCNPSKNTAQISFLIKSLRSINSHDKDSGNVTDLSVSREFFDSFKPKVIETLKYFHQATYYQQEEISDLFDLQRELIKYYGAIYDSYLENIDNEPLRHLLEDTRCLLNKYHNTLILPIVDTFSTLPPRSPLHRPTPTLKGKRLSDEPIYIIGIVFSDGLGDYYNMLAVAESIHREYPGQKIHVIFDFYGCYHRYSQILEPEVWFGYTIFDELPQKHRSQISKKIQSSPLVIDAGNDAYDIRQHIKHFLCDYSLEDQPTNWITIKEPMGDGMLGLGKEQKGLILFPADEPNLSSCDKIIADYLNPQLYDSGFCYVRDTSNFALHFILTNAAFYASSNKPLALFMKYKDLIPLLKNDSLQDLLLSYGIGKIKISQSGKFPWQRNSQEYAYGEGKTIVLIDCFPLVHSQFVGLARLCTSPFSGCTGDRSLAESIGSLVEIPFYENLSHKKEVWRDYIARAKEFLGNNHPYCESLIQHDLAQKEAWNHEVIPFEIAKIASKKECLEGLRKFHQHLMNNKNSKDSVVQLVNKHFGLEK